MGPSLSKVIPFRRKLVSALVSACLSRYFVRVHGAAQIVSHGSRMNASDFRAVNSLSALLPDG
jgi:hypothetical protein